MKKLLCILFTLMACSPDDAVPTKPVMNVDFDPSSATLLKMGTLEGVNHTVSGKASVYDDMGDNILLLDPFMSQNGPDLKVYLSKDVAATEYVRLGDLQSTTGKQTYKIPSGYNISDYKFVHIWCEEFSVEFGRAEIK